ncbi:serine/threonine-protein kinase [Nonomuraea sp. NEAU-A123]|uniref:serine/threonine-protein kinase n=1 Tax=Nonomuraea sp. NEAU-A123 TaxID=2839649 RepID=UPI001BE3EF14|nr:serine/threonine-protein kinase [Nonomuraea sp. NEAU-A123]MBT2235675.1 serine/threonine protein kinase [Nonomuraea sp. NEAU-A123]
MSDPGGFGPLEMDEREAIGPYRIVGRMGAGGMGVVYAGIAADGGRVAVKVIHPGLAADPHFRARFVREVDLLSRVRGRCTVSVLDADTAAMPPWLATEFVPGPTLNTYVRDNAPLAPDELLSFGVDIAEALTDIHRAGIVHRDLKPGNVIFSASGAKVLDFGIARALDESGLTGTGALIGTPGWISPEQYRGDQADAAADVFAWGALMAYASTGRPPFGTGAPDVLAYRVMSVDPDLSGVPAQIRDLVRSALAKDRAARPATNELLARVTAIRAGTTIPLPPPDKRRVVPLWSAAAVIAALVAVGTIFATNSAGTPEAFQSPSASPSSTYAETQTPDESEDPDETPTASDTPEETPSTRKTPKETPTTKKKTSARPSPRHSATGLPCASEDSILRQAAVLNHGSLPEDSVVKRKRCVGFWVAAELNSPSVGGVDLIAKRNATQFVEAEIGSNFCSLENGPALLATAPASIRTFLCPNGFS